MKLQDVQQLVLAILFILIGITAISEYAVLRVITFLVALAFGLWLLWEVFNEYY